LIGLLLSIFMTVIILAYGTIKFYQLVIKHNPLISVSVNKDVYSKKEALNLEKNKLFFAFSVNNFYGREPKDDPNFVDWLPQLVESDGNVNDVYTPLAYEKCKE
jgi:hypothetical protein